MDKYNVKVIGVQADAIERGEDRIEFKKAMNALGIEMARSQVAYSVDEALSIAEGLGYPVVLRPAYTMGGAGGGLVYNREELKTVCERGLQASLVGQVLVEESVLGWEELELEVVRDADNNMITVCFIENIDPMGVHTGDSFCAAPMLTISQETQKRLQEQAYRIVESVQVIGGTNVQFAHDPKTDRIVVIEINPRTSRSSALASKATGFPIALVSAMLASGLTLKEIANHEVIFDQIREDFLAGFFQDLTCTGRLSQRIALFHSYFDTYINLQEVNDLTGHILSEINFSQGTVRIHELADELHYSERHISRIFQDSMGITPKTFARIVRFQNVVDSILQQPVHSICDYMSELGYSDQAHFQREFKQYTGITPKRFLIYAQESAFSSASS